jgi:ketosteroid isomerase-like protein
VIPLRAALSRGLALAALAPALAAVAALAAGVAGCGTGNGARVRDPGVGGEDPARGLSRTELVDDLRSTVLEGYKALSGGYEEAYLDGLARDARLILIDVEPKDVLLGYEPAACRLRRQFPDKKMTLVSKSLEVHLSRDGSAGWTYDEVSYRVEHEGRRVIIPLRATSVYERQEGRWVKMMEHVSYGIPDEEAFAWAASGHGPRPASLGDDTPPGDAAANVRQIVLALIGDTDDTRTIHVAVGDDALVIGSDPEREIRGKAVAEFSTPRALYGYDYQVAPRGGLRVQVARRGGVAWAAGNIAVSTGETALELRATWVLEKSEEGVWRVVQTHLSVPVPKETLSLRVFGETIAAADDGAPSMAYSARGGTQP